MGKAHSKKKARLRASRSTLSSNEPLLLGTSLDLIYNDNFFDNPRYRRLLRKYQQSHGMKGGVASVPALRKKKVQIAQKSQSETVVPSTTTTEKPPSTLGIGVTPSRSPSKASRPGSSHSKAKSSRSGERVPSGLGIAKLSSLDKLETAGSDHDSDKLVLSPTETTEAGAGTTYNLPATQTSRIPRPARKQRSAFTTARASRTIPSSITTHKSDYEVYQKRRPEGRPTSLGKWVPSTSTPRSRSQPSRPGTSTLKESAIPEVDKPDQSESKRQKLIVRGLSKYINSRRRFIRETTSGPQAMPGRPALWSREFPLKGKFHPDKYIYEFEEGPKCPPRPVSAMAKCKKHGGRCDTCGIYSCDLCRCCKKCEIDCACPTKVNTACPPNPYAMPMDVYSELFRGDGWKKTCKVLCDLTEKEKMNPVGGNATKTNLAQKCTKRLDPVARNQMYQAQIDVLNPYKTSLCPGEEACPAPSMPALMPPPAFPMCAMPPMYPMPFMMPPMMPFYGPPPPFYPPPPPPQMMPPPPPPQDCYYAPPMDSFAPMPNY